MCNLEKEIKKLLKTSSKKDIVNKLSDICKILCNSVITVDTHQIKPIWVEAYYFNEGVFKDDTVHQNKRQSNNKRELYFHSMDKKDRVNSSIKGGYPGTDICLPLFDIGKTYYLSFLIKRSFLDGVYTMEKELEMKLRDKISSRECAIEPTTKEELCVCARVGVETKKFGLLELAAYNPKYVKCHQGHRRKLNNLPYVKVIDVQNN